MNEYEYEVDWKDKNNNSYTMEEISDSYLKSILNFITKGGGHTHFFIKRKNQESFL